MAKTFQHGVEALVAYDGAGNLLPAGHDFALDEQYQDLTSAKLANSRAGFIPIAQLEWYGSQGFIGWQMAAVLSQNWLIDKVCTIPGQDAVRNGYEITVNGGDEIDPRILEAMRRADKRMDIKGKMREYEKMSRIFGIRHALFLVDGIDYELPFNPDGIRPGSYRGISQIDPYWIAPMLDRSAAANPAAPDFYEPTWWLVNGKKVHRSHFIITRNGDLVPDILKPSYIYGGIPVPQKIYNRVYAAERCSDEAPMVLMTKRMTVLKTDTTKWFGPLAKAMDSIVEWMEMQTNYSVKVVGNKDEVQQFDTTLSGMDETIMTQYQLVAAAANVPATKLLGTSPKGFNATGESEESNYHEELESIQENKLSPFLERHHLCLMRSEIAPRFKIQPVSTEVKWHKTDSQTAKEEAEINEIKSRAANNYATAGAIDGADIRNSLIADPRSGFNGIEAIVPGGPGDRAAEQAEKEAAAELAANGAAGGESDAMDAVIYAGVLYQAGDRILLMKRADQAEGEGWWAFPAGKIEAGETALQAACREFQEETGKQIMRGVEAWSDSSFQLFCAWGDEFVPQLNEEHTAYVWCTPDQLPSPLHPNVAMQIEAVTGQSAKAAA